MNPPFVKYHLWPPAPWGPPKPDRNISITYVYSTHNFETGELFDFDVTSSKVSQMELQSSKESDNVLTQYPD